ncbi:MAG: HAD hydrolase family protein [Verrucomicrobiae bacterium]|nr:HAD hydrolase family protein [Verrucomicrobiae bacterium]
MGFPESSPWLLVTDVDDTLAGDPASLLDFARASGPVRVVLNSSRPRGSVARTMEEFPGELAIAGVVTALGTEIEFEGVPCREWTDRFRGWERSPVDAILRAGGFVPHPDEMQTPFKASYAVPGDRWEEVTERILEAAPGTRVIASGASDFDVIPAEAGKGAATLFVAGALGIHPDRLIVAGDSGNDLSMFAVAGRAIAVGNARRELIEAADPGRTFFARAPRAAGILEGLRHWGALPATTTTYG